MANVKSRIATSKRAPRNTRGKNKVQSTGTSDDIPEPEIVMRRPSNLRFLTTKEKIDLVLNNGHIGKKNQLVINYTPNKHDKKGKSTSSQSKSVLLKRSIRIKKKAKPCLELYDNILKRELLIEDSSKNKSNNNNNDSTLCNQNDSQSENNKDTKLSSEKSCLKNIRAQFKTKVNNFNKEKATKKSSQKLNSKEKKSEKKVEKHIQSNKTVKPSHGKKVTLSNGSQLTLSIFKCDYCGKTFRSKSAIRKHMYSHLGIKRYKCLHCKQRFTQVSNLKLHVTKQHTPVDQPEEFVCNICQKPFLLKENLALHLANHVKNENAYKCIYCNKKFSYHFLLLQHEKQHLAPGRFQCTICSMRYDCRARLTLHVKSHLKIKEHICQYCGKEFLRLNSMTRHVQICHGGHRIQCPICKKSLKGHLTEHMRTHEKKRPHECPECGQRFTQSTQLTVHRRGHTGARPYPCRICDRPFTHSNALMLHIRRHTGEKPFDCAMCPMKFSQLPHMKAHMKNIHGKENPYRCDKCMQFFKLKNHLADHAKTCTVGDKEMTFEERIQASIQHDEVEVVSVMTLSRMRFLLALLLTMVASKERLKYLGFNKRLIDDLLVESLEAMGQTPCKNEDMSPLKRLRENIQMLMEGTVPKDQMVKFKKENKSTEELLELLTNEKKSGI